MAKHITAFRETDHGTTTTGEASIDVWTDRLAQSAPDWMQDRRASLLVVAEPSAHAQFSVLADAVGARCLGTVTPAQAAHHIPRIANVDVIVIDVSDVAYLHAVLPLVSGMILDGDSRLILASPLDMLNDGFAALARHGLLDAPVQWLCAPDAADWAAALTLACADTLRPMALHDVGRDSDASRLQRLSEEVERLARTLDMLRGGNGASHGHGTLRDRNADYDLPRAPGWPMITPAAPGPDGEERMSAQTVRDLLRSRRLRDQFFGDDLFGDPAWDMMLDLMAARLAGERVSVSSLCIASAVPPTTALRWIRHLTERGIFERRPDPLDGRRVFIALSDDAAEAMQRWYATSRRVRREGSG